MLVLRRQAARLLQLAAAAPAALAAQPPAGAASAAGWQRAAAAALSTSAARAAGGGGGITGWLTSKVAGLVGGGEMEDLSLEEFATQLKRARQLGGLTGYVHGTGAVRDGSAQGTMRLFEQVRPLPWMPRCLGACLLLAGCSAAVAAAPAAAAVAAAAAAAAQLTCPSFISFPFSHSVKQVIEAMTPAEKKDVSLFGREARERVAQQARPAPGHEPGRAGPGRAGPGRQRADRQPRAVPAHRRSPPGPCLHRPAPDRRHHRPGGRLHRPLHVDPPDDAVSPAAAACRPALSRVRPAVMRRVQGWERMASLLS